MATVDPYTSRLEASIRLLTDRLAFMDGQTRQLVAENEALREELDLTTRRIEVEARERAQEILAAVDERRQPVAETDEVDRHREQLAEQAAALHGEARARIEQIRSRGSELATVPGSWPPPEGEPVADYPPPPEAEPRSAVDDRARADALQAEVDALLELREAIVTNIRETLLGFAEQLAAAERDLADDRAEA